MRSLSLLLLLLGLILLSASPSPAQVFESVGTRATGMAGAFVAVADDATAAYWNPAGLPTGAFFSLLVDHAIPEPRVDQSSPQQPAADWAGTMVALSTNAVAFSYYRLHINQIDRVPYPSASHDPTREEQQTAAVLRSILTHNVAVSGAQLVYSGVSLGTTLRYVRASVGMALGDLALPTRDLLGQAGALSTRTENKVDLDLGLMLGTETVRVGVVARNLLQPTFDTPDGGGLRQERQVRAGVGVRAPAGFLMAVDVDLSRLETVGGDRRNLAVGAERWFGLWLGIRGGARFNLEDDDPQAVGAFGLSLALVSGVYVDGQITVGRNSAERGWGIAGRVGF